MLLIRPNQTMPKPFLRLLALDPNHEAEVELAGKSSAETDKTEKPDSEPQYGRYVDRYKLSHIAPEQLEHIIRQVQAEDYHVEYLSSFAWKESQPDEVITAVNQWAKRSGLNVSINHERGICFFEKR